MADDGLIAAYLRELAFGAGGLSDADDILAEAEDHLTEVADRLFADGRSRAEAEAEAIARFGSAVLVARICVLEARRGVAVPTTRTRAAGLTALAAPIALIVGQYLNTTVDSGFVHGIGVALITAVIPAFVFVLWALRARHGGLGQLGKGAVGLAVVAPLVAFAGYPGLLAAMGMLGLAVVILVVEMLRANVLPVVPLVLLAAGPAGVLGLVAALSIAGGDAGGVWAYPMLLTVVGYVWIGGYLFNEPAADGHTRVGGRDRKGLIRRTT